MELVKGRIPIPAAYAKMREDNSLRLRFQGESYYVDGWDLRNIDTKEDISNEHYSADLLTGVCDLYRLDFKIQSPGYYRTEAGRVVAVRRTGDGWFWDDCGTYDNRLVELITPAPRYTEALSAAAKTLGLKYIYDSPTGWRLSLGYPHWESCYIDTYCSIPVPKELKPEYTGPLQYSLWEIL